VQRVELRGGRKKINREKQDDAPVGADASNSRQGKGRQHVGRHMPGVGGHGKGRCKVRPERFSAPKWTAGNCKKRGKESRVHQVRLEELRGTCPSGEEDPPGVNRDAE